MNNQNIAEQMNGIGVKAVIAIGVTLILSLFLPLEAPEPNQNDAIHWLMNSHGIYVLGWTNQIVSMLAFSFAFASAAWLVVNTHPVRTVISLAFTAMATMAFFIVKFVNVWSVPLMAKALASGAEASSTAATFLTAHAPSVAFGFGPSMDYLGFLLYAIAGLLIYRPMMKLSKSAKVAAIGLLLYGILYFATLLAPYADILGQADIEVAVLISALPLLVSFVALYFSFKGANKQQ